MNLEIGPIYPTPTTLLTNDAWCAFIAIAIGLILWTFDKPNSKRGRHLLFPLWLIVLMLTSFAAFCFFLNLIPIGKCIIILEVSLLFILSFFVLMIFVASHFLEVKSLRESKIHQGIKDKEYYE